MYANARGGQTWRAQDLASHARGVRTYQGDSQLHLVGLKLPIEASIGPGRFMGEHMHAAMQIQHLNAIRTAAGLRV